MPTTITTTIGATSSPTTPDYTTLQAWEDAITANLVTADEIHEGQCLDQGTFTSGVSIGGHTTDATRFIRLTTASGASFKDKAGVRSSALLYNTSDGVTIETSGQAIVNAQAYTRFEGLQVKRTAYSGASGFVTGNVAGVIVDKCIVDHSITAQDSANFVKVRNCLIKGNGNGQLSEFYGCTFIGPGSGAAFAGSYSNLPKAVNCAIFNFASYGTGTPKAGTDYNATDLASVPLGSNNVTSLTFADQFENSSTDFRAISTGDLQAGTPDATNTPDDISDETRDATTPWIGCWEVAGGGGGGLDIAIAAYHYNHHLTSMA
jgi:hypothetical protein